MPKSAIKVPQSVIDDIKKMGMTKALAGAKNASPVMAEALRRMYGEKRVAAAKGTAVATKSADAARAGVTKPATKAAVKAVSTKAGPKKDNTKSNILKATAGTAAAVGLLVGSRGKAASAAAKLSPAVSGLSKSAVGKALFGTGEKLTTKGTAMAGRMTAKAGKPVSQTQYEAMQAAAKAKGIKAPTAEAAKKAATKTTAKAPVKPISNKKLAVAGVGTGSVTLKGDTKRKK